jgi:holo-[acyl-carrier protein] synthase
MTANILGMIYGVGIDLVSIRRIERSINRWSDRFVQRVFTPDEAKVCYQKSFPPSAFALRFAAKEAFSKALGLGMTNGLKWREIEVYNQPSGRPDLKLHGTSFKLCRRKGITGIHLSLSDEGEYGVAMVVLEKDGAVEES